MKSKEKATEPKSNPQKAEPAMQGMWSGTVSFSLVAIPVRLIKAVETGRVSFRMLHSKDYSPLTRRMFCPVEDRMLSADEIVRGYEIAPGKHILIAEEELESVSPERSRTIEIVEFIDIKEIDPIYYDRPYYLVPAKGGEKAYRLLVEVMRRTGRAGLAKFVLSDREYLVAIKSTGEALALITLHYSADILPDNDILPRELKAESEEKARLKKTVKKMIADFDPEKYADTRRAMIIELLDKKLKTKSLVEAPVVEEGEAEGPPDLIAALQESMRKVKQK